MFKNCSRETPSPFAAPLRAALVQACLSLAPALFLLLHAPPAVRAQSLTQEQYRQLSRGIVKINAAQNGSGIIVGGAGDTLYIITALHVIGAAKDIRVIFYDKPGETFRAESHMPDESMDMAVIKVAMPPGGAFAPKLPGLKMSDVALNVGVPVMTIGHGNDTNWQFYNGHISRPTDGSETRRFRHTDQVEQGDSGAPVFDEKGHLLGMVLQRLPRMKGASSLQMKVIHQVLTEWRVPTTLLRAGRRDEDYGGPEGTPSIPFKPFKIPVWQAKALSKNMEDLSDVIKEGKNLREALLSDDVLRDRYVDWSDKCSLLLGEIDKLRLVMGFMSEGQPGLKDEFESAIRADNADAPETREQTLQKFRKAIKFLEAIKIQPR